MNDAINYKTIKARLAPAIIAAIITVLGGLVVAGIAYKATTYQARHDDTGIRAGYTHELSFPVSSSTKSASFTLKPVSGNLHFSALQKSGKVDSNRPYYRVKSKKISNSGYTTHKPNPLTFKKNNVYSEEYYMRYVEKGETYCVLVERYSGCKYKSKLVVDWVVK